MANKTFPLTIKISAALSNALRGFTKLQTSLKNISKAANDLGKSLSVKVTAPILGIGAASLRSAANIETVSVAFESLTGSAEQAEKTVKSLIEFTAKTPFQLDQVAGASRQLLAAGVSTEDIQSKLLILGDIAAGANIPLNDMAAIFVKIKNKQKAQAEEINQLSERGIPIIQALAKEMGVAEKEIFGLGSKGKISFELIERALSNMRSEGGIFANQMERQSRTLAGIFSTLKDNISLAGAELGNAIVQTTSMKDSMNGLIKTIQDLTVWFKGLSPEMQNFIVTSALVVAALGPLLFLFGQLGFAIIGITNAAIVLTPVIMAVGKALLFLAANPIGLVITGIGLLIYNFYKLTEVAGSVKRALMATFLGLGSLIVNTVLYPIQSMLKAIISALETVGITVPDVAKKVANFNFDDYASRALSSDTTVAGPALNGRLDVNFNNAPQGTRVLTQSTGALDINTDVGLQLARP